MGFSLGGLASGAINIGGALLERNWAKRDAQRQMDFQSWMSSTSRQRDVQDLEAAGLNPLMALNTGSAMGSGAMATPTKVGEALSGSLRDAERLKNESKLLESSIEKQNEEKELLKAQKQKTQVEATVLSKEIPKAEIINKVYDFIKKQGDKLQKFSPKLD